MRIQWIDIAKGITILCVIYGHAVHEGVINTALYIFRMPLFFILSGYLFNKSKWLYNGKGFILNRLKRLILPYILMAVITNGIHALWILYYTKVWNTDVTHEVLGMLYASHGWLELGVLWFLPCLFVSEMIFWTSLRLFGSCGKGLFIISIFYSFLGYIISQHIELPWSIDIALVAQTFLMCGYTLKCKDYINLYKKKTTLILFGVYVVIFFLNGKVDMNTRLYGNIVLFLIGGVVGTILVSRLSILLECGTSRIKQAFTFCGQESLIFLLFHMDVIYYFRRFFFWSKFGLNSNDIIIYSIYVILATLIGILTPLIVAKYLTRLSLFRVLSGRKLNKA